MTTTRTGGRRRVAASPEPPARDAAPLPPSPLPPLPPLDAPCVKCGSESRRVAWLPPAAERHTLLTRLDDMAYAEPREHMFVTCEACGYQWPAAPLDALTE